MDLIPLRIAAGTGEVNGAPASQYVAAGFTLLQRCAPLVRALAGKRSAILVPPSAAAVCAIAASDGRGALILDPGATPSEWVSDLREANVGAVITLRVYVAELRELTKLGDEGGAAALPLVLLDDAPTSATFVPASPNEESRLVDLGSHFGLDLAGTLDDPLRDDEFLLYRSGDRLESLTHRALVERSRELAVSPATPALIRELIFPLLAANG